MENMPSFENKKPELLEIAQELGFSPGSSALEIKNSINYEKSFEENRKFIVDFIIACQDEITNIEDIGVHDKAQIGLFVYMAEVYKKLNNTEMYEDSINDAIEYARQYDMKDIVGRLKNL